MKKIRELKIPIISFLLAGSATIIIFAVLGIHPFGDKSLLFEDLYIQYIEFFAYLRKILLGEASAVYSFSKSLGGPMISIIGYYLSSPLNFLVIFFEQKQLQDFVALIAVLKIGLCGGTFSFFLKNRFRKLENKWVLLASCSYALMQYNMLQMSNIMWLDGVYMLPVLMTYVWKYVNEKKKLGLCIAVALGILFNWYTGYMNCLFIVLYFLYEQIIKDYNEKTGFKFQDYVKKFIKFCFFEGVGVLLISAFFIPVVIGLSNGKASFSWDIFSFNTKGSILNILRGFIVGYLPEGFPGTETEQLSLYCGTLFLILGAGYFFNKRINKFEKTCSAILLCIMVFSCFFTPLENIWNGFRFALSYYCRFSYIAIAVIVFLAALNLEKEEKENKKRYYYISGAGIVLLLVLDLNRTIPAKNLWAQICILLFWGLCLRREGEKHHKIIPIFFLLEMCLNGVLIGGNLYTTDYNKYVDYSEKQTRLVNQIQQNDKSIFYRMEQTWNREFSSSRVSALLDEGLSYGYKGIGHYSSGFDSVTAEFINKLGYSDYTDLTIYNEPILSSDSLLGVKYLMSDISFEGWDKMEGYDKINGKEVYYNPYALSVAFKTGENISNADTNQNPFLYQNNIYSALLGRRVEIFKEINAEYSWSEEGVNITIPSNMSNGIVYGYGRFSATDLALYINDEYRCNYQRWLSYLVFNIGNSSETNTVSFRGNLTEDNVSDMQFYYLDMNLFTSVIEELQSGEISILEMSDTSLKMETEAVEGETAVLTIPYDSGWCIKVNGQEVDAEKVLDTFLAIPLQKGHNDIEITYHMQGLKLGGVVTGGTVLIIGSVYIIKCINKRRKCREQSKDKIILNSSMF